MRFTISQPEFFELIVKKSRFITYVEPIRDVAEAKSRLADIRAEYPDARHVCFAFYVNGQTGMSDDGEPSGTAGKPMFNVLSHKKLENVLAVVVRYFGGIKLGAGGLSRAYGGAVSQTLENATFIEIETIKTIQLAFSFAMESDVRRALIPFSAQLDHVEYSECVTATVELPESKAELAYEALLAVAPGNSNLDVRWAD